MRRERKILLAKVAVLGAALPIVLWAYEYGPYSGFCGVPGEGGTCTASGCHTGTTNNPANKGSVTVNFPNGLNYTPGVKQHITVVITDPAPSQTAWGFELTARAAGNTQTQAGSFASSDANTQVKCVDKTINYYVEAQLNFGGSQICPATQPLSYIEHSLTGFTYTQGKGSGTYQFDWTPPATNIGNITFYIAANAGVTPVPAPTASGDHIYATTYTLTPAAAPVYTNTYYFPHFALGGGWQTVLTYVNYSQQAVTCQTNFYGDAGTALLVPFGGAAASSRTDTLPPGGEEHLLSTADPSASGGWAQGQCTGPVKASMLFRLFNSGGTAVAEAGVNASTAGATKFVSYAQTLTGVAYANPSTSAATVTVAAFDSTGKALATTNINLAPNAHRADNLGPLLGLASFTGSVQITSTVPIVSLSINAEAFPVVSSLPPGEVSGSGAQTYYFPHFALGSGWQTILTYVNYSAQSVTCTTNFYGDSGAALAVPFGGAAAASRTDILTAGAEIHSISTAAPSAVGGWAIGQCTGPVKASMLFRFFTGGTPTAEAGVNASTVPTTKFVTYAQSAAGLAFANTSASAASVMVIAVDNTGAQRGTATVNLQPNAHTAANLGNLISNLSGFSGSVQIISTVPIVSLSLNAEAFPAFSSLPPGDLSGSTPLSTGY